MMKSELVTCPAATSVAGGAHSIPLLVQFKHGCARSRKTHFNFRLLQASQLVWGCRRRRAFSPSTAEVDVEMRRFIVLVVPASAYE